MTCKYITILGALAQTSAASTWSWARDGGDGEVRFNFVSLPSALRTSSLVVGVDVGSHLSC